METLTWAQIIVLFLGSSGVVVSLIQVLKTVWDKFDTVKAARKAQADTHLSETNMKSKIQLEGLEFTQSGFIKLIERLEHIIVQFENSNEELRKEVLECEKEKERVRKELTDLQNEVQLLKDELVAVKLHQT